MNKTITLLVIGVIFLALVLMVFNSFMKEERPGVPAVATEKARPLENAAAVPAPSEERAMPALSARQARSSDDLASLPSKGAPHAMEDIGIAPAAPSVEGVAVKTVPARIDAGQTAPANPAPVAPVPQASAPSPSVPSVPSAMPEPETGREGSEKNITSIVVYATQEGATLRLGGDRPLVYKSMLLRKPARLVIDFEGQWNVNVPGIPQNRLIKAVRVGRQADSTRMVVDLHREPASYRLIKLSPQRLDVRLR